MAKLRIEVWGDKDLANEFARMARELPRALGRGIAKAASRVLKRAQTTIYAGHAAGHLNVGTGYLRQHLGMEVDERGLVGYVGVRGNVPYAAIHEFGGRTSAHVIRPRRAKALRWYDGEGNPVFARYVNHPGSVIPARPYLRPAIEHEKENIRADIIGAIEGVLTK